MVVVTINKSIVRFISYYIYVIAVGYVVIQADDYIRYMQIFSKYYNLIQICFLAFFPVFVGLLLGLPRFISTVHKQGYWKCDWILLLAVGLPTFCVVLLALLSLTQVTTEMPLIGKIGFVHNNLVTISGIVFGYVLVTVFNKQSQ